jgi:type IV pilus assembly protein PilW
MKTTRQQNGMTLIEIMIALTLSLLLIGGVIQLFLTSKQTFRMNEALARVQESGRLALDNVSRDLRMAGYQGCADPGSVGTESAVLNNAPTANLSQTAIAGSEGGAAADTLTLQFGSGLAGKLTQNIDLTNAQLTADSNPEGIAVNDVLILADCATVHMLRVTAVNTGTSDVTFTVGASENDLSKLTKVYGPSSQVLRFNSVTYSVAPSGRRNERGEVIKSLFRQGLGDANPVEFVEGVENLQVQYGERLANGSMRYSDAGAAGLDMSKVESVRIGLLMAAMDVAGEQSDNKNYVIAGTTVGPEGSGATVTHPVDKHIRRAFNTTVTLRNRR